MNTRRLAPFNCASVCSQTRFNSGVIFSSIPKTTKGPQTGDLFMAESLMSEKTIQVGVSVPQPVIVPAQTMSPVSGSAELSLDNPGGRVEAEYLAGRRNGH